MRNVWKLETERLLLRPFANEDLDLIYRIYSDEEILRFTPFDTMDREQAKAHLRGSATRWRYF